MRIQAALGCCVFAALVGSAWAFQCMTDVDLGPAALAARKGIALDDSTLRWCAAQIPDEWPNAAQPMTSIRLFKAWDALWGEDGREAAWGELVDYVKQAGAKVLIGTQITCSEEEDMQAWVWTKELVQMLHPEHVMGLAIGNELELLQFKGTDLVPEECVTRIWEEGYYWRQFQHIVSEFNALGFENVPVTAVFTGLALAGNPFYEVPGRARVGSLVRNATSEYGGRFAFTFNFYPYFDPNMHLDAGTTDQCESALAVASCWGHDCVVPGQMRQARLKMQQVTGSEAGTLWIGETGWSSPLSQSLETRMKPCEAWSSMGTFKRFYQGFLEWDMEIGGGHRAPDHIFWFTMRDAWNFGVGEHFGLIAACDEPSCKVRSADYVPARFTLLSEEEEQKACGDEALYNGWVHGKDGCKNRCIMDAACTFYSEWAESHDNMRWCRHTRTCSVLQPSDYLVSVYRREEGTETATSSTSRITTSVPSTSTEASSTSTSMPPLAETTSTTESLTTSKMSTTKASTTMPPTTSTTEVSTTEASTTTPPTTTTSEASTIEPSTTEVSTTEAPTTPPSATSTSEASTSEALSTAPPRTSTSEASTTEASTTEVSTSEAPTTETPTTTPSATSTRGASTTEATTTTPPTTSTSEASTTEASTTQASTTEAPATSTTEVSTTDAFTTTPPTTSTSEASTTEASTMQASTTEAPATSTTEVSTTEASTTTPPTTSTSEASTTEASTASTTEATTTTLPTTSTSEASTTAASTTQASTTEAPTTTPSATSPVGTSTTEASTTRATSTTVETTAAPEPATSVARSSTSAAQRTTTSAPAGSCEFEFEPVVPGYFWDPTCEMGTLGCNADGKNVACRLCGADVYASIPCPPSSCHFSNEPEVPYYWDNECDMGKLGCWADGIHAQCRFCGEHPYTNISCPDIVATPRSTACAFANEPETRYYWEPECREGMRGCLADGVHVGCRFCGEGSYADIPCPSGAASDACTFANEPLVPYYWDPQCQSGMIGCMADGIHVACRFCEARPFEDVPCPGEVAPPTGSCAFAGGAEPETPHFWDETCAMGKLGCWADGLHAQCRFCGRGLFREVPCPDAGQESAQMAASTAPAPAGGFLPPGRDFQPGAATGDAPARDIAPGTEDEDVPLSGARRGAFRVGVLICPTWLLTWMFSSRCAAW